MSLKQMPRILSAPQNNGVTLIFLISVLVTFARLIHNEESAGRLENPADSFKCWEITSFCQQLNMTVNRYIIMPLRSSLVICVLLFCCALIAVVASPGIDSFASFRTNFGYKKSTVHFCIVLWLFGFYKNIYNY